LSNGKIFIYPPDSIPDVVENDKPTLEIKGKIEKVYRDQDTNKTFFVLHYVDE
jgi:hypothetical protein